MERPAIRVTVPELALVVLIGPSGAGKSTFARKHFRPTEIVSSDTCRGLVCDDETSLAATADAFELVHLIAAKRLRAGRLTVIDATSVKAEHRRTLIELARAHHVQPVAIVFDIPPALCHQRNQTRPDRSFGPEVTQRHSEALRRGLAGLANEGFRGATVLSTPEEVDAVVIERRPLWSNRRSERGPFDIIGDVHGCFDELMELFGRLGYEVDYDDEDEGPRVVPPPGRKAIFLGDLVDRGPKTPSVLRLAMSMVAAGHALCLPGNHEVRLLRKLAGRNVKLTHGLAETWSQLELESHAFRQKVGAFIDSLVSHYVLDDGKLVVAHAGLREELQGRSSGRVREFALYGETTGETDAFGLPVRYNWAADYRGKAMVVYGHTPVPEAVWLGNTICIDTGCVFGGKLSALRYPERELVQVQARAAYYVPAAKPLEPAALDMPESPPPAAQEPRPKRKSGPQKRMPTSPT